MSVEVLNPLAPIAAVPPPVIVQDPEEIRLPQILAAVNSCTNTPLTEDDIRAMVQAAKEAQAAHDGVIQVPLKLKRKENPNLKRNMFLTPDGKCRILMTCTKLGDQVISDVGAFKVIKRQVVIDLNHPDQAPEVEALGICKKKRCEANPTMPSWATIQKDFQQETEMLHAFHGCEEVLQTSFSAHEADKSYLGMELCDGDLFDAISLGVVASKTPVEQLQLARDCAQGLAFLHKDGYIYRDLKPDNFLMKKGRVKLADLGIACRTNDQERQKQAKGSPLWLSPELAEAICAEFDALIVKATTQAGDLFSLGVLFCWLFASAKLPFQAGQHPLPIYQTAALTDLELEKHITNPNLKIPNNMRNLILKMVKYKPEERITAAEVVAALDAQIAALNP